ncbi:MAG: ParB N-terminal domain-containing protein [Hyphomicrobiales bacterium]|nr:ParB N-terminal domain-containing protein [Hyphomicrobiales bacterium]
MNKVTTTRTSKNSPVIPERMLHERIGEQEWLLSEIKLDVHDQVSLWDENPRLLTAGHLDSEELLEEALRLGGRFNQLKKSLREIGQLQPIYARRTETGKYLVLEGNSRVTALRDLNRENPGRFCHVITRVVPDDFGDRAIAILLAGVHVRGSGVREWSGYVQARFIYDTVTKKPVVLTQADLAKNMGRSEGWVSRRKNAYEFALKYIEYLGGETTETRKETEEKFTILEEVSKVAIVGRFLRNYDEPKHDNLRKDVFDMVYRNAFKEHRDARYLKYFYDNADWWEQMKSGEEHIAHHLSKQVGEISDNPKAKIAEFPGFIERAIKKGGVDFNEDDAATLQQAMDHIQNQIHNGAPPYRLAVKRVVQTFNKASRDNIPDLTNDDIANLADAYQYFMGVVEGCRK